MLSIYYKSLNNNFEIVYELINSTSIKLNCSGDRYKKTSKIIWLLTGSPNPSRIILLKHLPFKKKLNFTHSEYFIHLSINLNKSDNDYSP